MSVTFDAHKNFAYTTISVVPSPATSGTSLTVWSATGSRFPATPFNAVICAFGQVATPLNSEIVRVTNISGDVFTIVRSQESSSARTIITGDQIFLGITAGIVQAIESAVSTLDSNATTLSGTVTTLSNNYTTLNGTVTTLSGNVSTLTSEYSTLNTTVSGLSTSVSTLNSEYTTVSGNVSTLTTEYSTLNTTVGTLSSEYTTLNTTVGTLSSEYTTVSGNVSTLTSEYSTLNTTVGTLSSEYSTLNTTVGTLSSEYTTLNTSVGTLSSNYTTLSGTVTTLGTTSSSHTTSISTLNTEVSAVNAVMDNTNRWLLDSTPRTSIDWQNRTLNATDGTVILDYANKELLSGWTLYNLPKVDKAAVFLPLGAATQPTVIGSFFSGGNLGSETRIYYVSHTTTVGETLLSDPWTINGSGLANIRVAIHLPADVDSTVLSTRVWRAKASDTTQICLLTEVDWHTMTVNDNVSNADFEAFSTTPAYPTVDTSGSVIFAGDNTAPILAFNQSQLTTRVNFTIQNNITIPFGANDGYLLTSDADGLATWQAPTIQIFEGHYSGGTPDFTPTTTAIAFDIDNDSEWKYYNGSWH